MRGLATFVMGSRLRAMLVAMASSGNVFFGWIGAAVVALVTLRRGPAAGVELLGWALLPALLATLLFGDSTQVLLLLGTTLLALTLRISVSFRLATLASVAVAVLCGLGLLVFERAAFEEMQPLVERWLSPLAERSTGAASDWLEVQVPVLLAGAAGTVIGSLCLLCLSLARYWQAALYKPGGFGEEFRALRFPPLVVSALLLAAAGLVMLEVSYMSWAAALLIPVTVTGFSLAHCRAHLSARGSFWLVGFYFAWLLFNEVRLALLALVAADAVLDFRRRWGLRPPAASTRDGGPVDRRDDDNDDDEQHKE